MSDSSQVNDPTNLHLLAIKQHYHCHRRSSDGNYLSPCEVILRIPSLPTSKMEESTDSVDTRSRSHSLSPCSTLGRIRSSSLSQDVPLSVSLSYTPHSGSSSPCTSEPSVASCSELVAAIEALKIDLQQQQQEQNEREFEGKEEMGLEQDLDSSQNADPCDDLGRTGMDGGKGHSSPVKSLSGKRIGDVAEKEKILNECKNQIKTLTATNKSLEKKLLETERDLLLAAAHKIPSRKNLKCWPRTRGCVQDLEKKLTLDDSYVEPSEIISVLLESERRYVTGLTILNSHYQQPMRMLSSFKPEILSMQQLNTLFLNCTELVVLHRLFYEDLLQIPSLPETAQVDKLFEVLENTFPAFGHYNSYLAGNRLQNIQKELRQLKSKPQFELLLNHCQQNCEGISLTSLLKIPTERMSEYTELLTHFLNPRVRALPEDASKRAEALIRFLRNLRYDLSEEKSEWDHTLEKIKLLNKLAPDGLVPLEIFNSDVRLMKQGPLTQVVGKKEAPRHCILFNNYIALGQSKDNQYRIMENGMIPLYGAQLHKCVDVEGQAIGSDLQSGLSEDKLAFKLNLMNNESLYLRAARPNERKQWVEILEKGIQESQKLQLELEMDISDHRPLYPVDAGPKIAAASLEKLFQQLTSPHFELHQDFRRVFLLTHSCFTTPKDVLTALLNCIKSPDDNADRISQSSGNDLFLFNMLEDLSGSGSDCVSASPSIYTINTDSEIGSPGHSPSVVRRSASSTHTSIISSSPSPNALLRTGNSARKAIYSGASFASTDSDISPHTSALVVDNGPVSTRDGWADAGEPELSVRSRLEDQLSSLDVIPFPPSSSPGESDYYSKLYPPNRVCIEESEASDGEMEGRDTLRERISVTQSLAISGCSRGLRYKARRSISETTDDIELGSLIGDEEDTIKETINGIDHSKRMNLELNEASEMMLQLTESLDTEFSCVNDVDADVFSKVTDNRGGTVKRRDRTHSDKGINRLGKASSFSNSEPDLSGCGVDGSGNPPPLPPRDPDMLLPRPMMLKQEDDLVTKSLGGYRRQQVLPRRGSEHSLLSLSMNFGLAGSMQKSADNKQSNLKKFGKEKKSKTVEGASLKSKKKSKKSDTFSGRATPTATSSALSSPARTSSTMYFPGSPSHSFTAGDMGKSSPKKSKWYMIRKAGKKVSRSPSIDQEEVKINKSAKPRRSQSIPSIRNCGVYGSGRSTSITSDINITDGGGQVGVVSPRVRRGSTSQNSVTLVSKIFSILNTWVEDYFEDFEANSELTQSLSEFLEGLTTKSSSDSLEYHMSYQLLVVLNEKKEGAFSPPPNCPFPVLLNRVIRVKHEVLNMYDWEHPDKLIKGKEIDLSKTLPTLCLKMIAEQLTLMEFSVYGAIQRKELLNCNWKKPEKETLSPNVCRLIRRTNDMTSWVSTEILQCKTASQRATVIEHFIQIAYYCYKHNDIHCALNITIALGSACIKSLRHTWSEVDKKYRQRVEKLKESMDYHGRCKKMRENLEQLTQETLSKTGKLPAVLPYIGAYLDVIYTLDISSKTYNEGGLVNFAKMTKLAEIVTTVLQYQDVGFNFEPKLDVMAYVTASKRLSENDLFELSMMIEPPSN